jgi:hypothetical protein
LVSYAHPLGDRGYSYPGQLYSGAVAREAPVDVALGQIDAFEIFCSTTQVDLYYRLLNCGFSLAVTAGTDAYPNRTYAAVPGGERVYVYTGNKLDYGQWIEGLRSGRSYATRGPLLEFEINGRKPGDRIQLESSRSLRVKSRSWSWLPLLRLEVVANGKVIAQAELPPGKSEIVLSRQIDLSESAWLAARVWGPRHRLVMNELTGRDWGRFPPEVLLAHSSPIYVELGGKKISSQVDARYLEDWIEQLINDVRTRGVFHRESRRQEVIDLFRKGQRKYQVLH